MNHEEKQLILSILDYLKTLNRNQGSKKMYFSGEFDSFQTKFEKASNYYKVGTVASSDLEGKVLLSILRMIVDVDYDWIYQHFDRVEEDEEDEEDIDVNFDTVKTKYWEKFIRVLEKAEETYGDSFEITDSAGCMLTNGRVVRRTAEEIQDFENRNSMFGLWNLERIEKYIQNM